MTTSLVEQAMKQAHQPAAVIPRLVSCPIPPFRRDLLPDHVQNNVKPYEELLEFSLMAAELRAHALRQTARAVEVIAGFDKLRWSRLKGTPQSNTPRKPRILLWAESNQRDTLEVLWLPVLDEGAEHYFVETAHSICQKSDYLEYESTWPYYGGRSNVVLRFLGRDYVQDTLPVGGREYTVWGKELVKTALIDALAELLNALNAVADVSVKHWPDYNQEGRLWLTSAESRARATLKTTLAKLEPQRKALRDKVQQRLHKLGLSNAAEFEELQAAAEQTGTKLTKLLFEKTGVSVTAHTTGALPSWLKELRQCELDCAEVSKMLSER